MAKRIKASNKQIRRLKDEGKTVKEIAKLFNCTTSAIYYRLKGYKRGALNSRIHYNVLEYRKAETPNLEPADIEFLKKYNLESLIKKGDIKEC